MPRILSVFLSKICPLVAAAGIFSFMPSAHATIWNIDAVLNGGNVPGFGASSFHDATGDVMSGDNKGTISFGPGSFGTYDDLTGNFSATLSVSPSTGTANSFTLSGDMLFGGMSVFGALENPSTLDAIFNGTMNTGGGGTLPGNMTTLGFSGSIVCCNTNGTGPNSFLAQGSEMAIMTLWGANGFGTANNYGNYPYDDYPTLGMDLQLKLTAVPIPAALPLLGTGLAILGFLGWRRRRKAVEAV